MSHKVVDLEVKLETMKKMSMLQTAETKAAMTSLEEKLSTAEEQAAESQGGLEVSEAHAKDLEQQLIKKMARRRKAEEHLHPELILPFLHSLQKQMWRARLLRERREGKLSQEKLLEASRRVEATQRKLKKLQDVKKHPGKAARKSPAAMGKKIEAAKQELMHLMSRKKLQERQEALDRVNLDAKCHAENVEELKSRSPNLKEMMRNMDKADQEQLHQATAESQRIQQLFASVDQELRKGRSRRRQNSMQRWCRSFYQREKEEQRAKNEEFEAKFIGLDVEDGEKELHQVKQEITKLNAQIFEEQQKAQSADKAIREEQEKYQVELKTKALREQQKKTMTALLAGKDEAISSLEGRFYKLKREAKAAKQLLEKEEEKAAQQEQAAEKEMEIKRRKRLEGEGKLIEVGWSETTVEWRGRESEEGLRRTGGADAKKTCQRDPKRSKSKRRENTEKQVKQEKENYGKGGQTWKGVVARARCCQRAGLCGRRGRAVATETAADQREEDQRMQRCHKQMQDLEQNLDKQRKASAEKVKMAKMKLQNLQDEVIGEEKAPMSKKLQRVIHEAKVMEVKANAAEVAEEEPKWRKKIRRRTWMPSWKLNQSWSTKAWPPCSGKRNNPAAEAGFSGKGAVTGTGRCVGVADSGCTGQISQQVPPGSRCPLNWPRKKRVRQELDLKKSMGKDGV